VGSLISNPGDGFLTGAFPRVGVDAGRFAAFNQRMPIFIIAQSAFEVLADTASGAPPRLVAAHES
jgi:hypothetical protein